MTLPDIVELLKWCSPKEAIEIIKEARGLIKDTDALVDKLAPILEKMNGSK